MQAPPTTPYAVVAAVEQPRPASKRELIALCRELEERALDAPPEAVAVALQDQRHLTARTRAVYTALAAQGTQARMLARGLQSWIAPGVTGVSLDDDDPLVDEWVLVVPGPDPVVLAATDLALPGCADLDRSFTVAVSRDRHVVSTCATLLGL